MRLHSPPGMKKLLLAVVVMFAVISVVRAPKAHACGSGGGGYGGALVVDEDQTLQALPRLHGFR